MYEDDEDLELSDVEYFVKDYMASIDLMSKCRKNDVNFFLNYRDSHLDDVKSDIHINHPSKQELIESIKKLGFEEDFINVDLNDAVNAIFLHKIDEITIQDSLGELILGMTPDNYMQKLYHYTESYTDEQDVDHYKDAYQFGYVVDKITDTYKILMKYIILNLKSNFATFLEDYYQTEDGIDFVKRANENAINGNGRITKKDFYYFVDKINKASLLEPLITKEDNILIYKLPEVNQLGGFFVTVNNGLKFSLSIMDATDRSGKFSRFFKNTLFSKLIYDGVVKKLNKLAKKDNVTIENYWENKIINNDENKVAFIDSVFIDNHQYFDDIKNYYSHSSRPICFQVNKKQFFLNQSYIDRFSRTLKNINREKMLTAPTRLKINHNTNVKVLKDLKITDDLETQLNQMSSNSTYMRAVLRPMYQLKNDLIDFHINIKEVHYVYNHIINKRCFSSVINQDILNDKNHYNQIIKFILENFILGEKSDVKKNIKDLSKQDVYNIVQYLEVFIFKSIQDPVNILSKRLKEINVKVDVKYFIDCILHNFMCSDHKGITYNINTSLSYIHNTLENYEEFKLKKKRSNLAKILNPLLDLLKIKRKKSQELYQILEDAVENNQKITIKEIEIYDLYTELKGEINEINEEINKYMPIYDKIDEQIERIEKEKKKDNEDEE